MLGLSYICILASFGLSIKCDIYMKSLFITVRLCYDRLCMRYRKGEVERTPIRAEDSYS